MNAFIQKKSNWLGVCIVVFSPASTKFLNVDDRKG